MHHYSLLVEHANDTTVNSQKIIKLALTSRILLLHAFIIYSKFLAELMNVLRHFNYACISITIFIIFIKKNDKNYEDNHCKTML